MTERSPLSESSQPNPEEVHRQNRAALEALYIAGDPRGIGALPENVEYDVRKVPTTGIPEIGELPDRPQA